MSSSVNDMARWLTMVLANGTYDGQRITSPEALLPAITPQVISTPSANPKARASFYGHGFSVSVNSSGRTTYSHSGAFTNGEATNFVALPSEDLAIIALTNGAPYGIPETLTGQFMDLVQYGQVREDWGALYKKAIAPMNNPEGSLLGKQPPANPGTGPATDRLCRLVRQRLLGSGRRDGTQWRPAALARAEEPDLSLDALGRRHLHVRTVHRKRPARNNFQSCV